MNEIDSMNSCKPPELQRKATKLFVSQEMYRSVTSRPSHVREEHEKLAGDSTRRHSHISLILPICRLSVSGTFDLISHFL